jgi:hypothetical protein
VTWGMVDSRRRTPSRISGSPLPQDIAIVAAVQGLADLGSVLTSAHLAW